MRYQDILADLVVETMEENNLSTYDIERNATKAGLKISQAYISRIKNATVGKISVPLQKALAAGLKIEPYIIFDIVNGVTRTPTSFDESVIRELKRTELTKTQQQEILQVISRLVFAMSVENRKKAQESTFNPKGVARQDFKFESKTEQLDKQKKQRT